MLHAALRLLPEPDSKTAPQLVINVVASMKMTGPVGLVPVTVAESV